MPKSGTFKSGEGLSGESSILVIGDNTTDVQVATPAATVSGAGAVAIAGVADDIQVATPAAKIRLGFRILDTALDVELATPTADITGTGAVAVADGTLIVQVAPRTDQIAFAQYVINNVAVQVQSVRLTPTSLRLDIRARSATTRSLLDTLDGNAGAVDERERADGTVDGLDLANGGNTFTVIPPIRQQPERVSRDWVVESITRDRTSADTQATIAGVDLVNNQTRDAVTGYADAADSDAYTFDFGAQGTIVTSRVSNIRQGETTSVDVILEPAQAELFETTAAATAGAIVRTVPDGETFSEDTTPNARQTVTVTPPSGASAPALAQGDYVISDWTSEGSDGAAYRVTMQLSSRYQP